MDDGVEVADGAEVGTSDVSDTNDGVGEGVTILSVVNAPKLSVLTSDVRKILSPMDVVAHPISAAGLVSSVE